MQAGLIIKKLPLKNAGMRREEYVCVPTHTSVIRHLSRARDRIY